MSSAAPAAMASSAVATTAGSTPLPPTTTTDSLSAGAIAGIAVGIAVVCLVLLSILILAMRRKQQESQRRQRGALRCLSVDSRNADVLGGAPGLARPVTARERAGAIVRGELLNSTSRTTGNVGAGTVPSSQRLRGAGGDSVHVEMQEVGDEARRSDSNGRARTVSEMTSTIGSDSGVDEADSMASLPIIGGGAGSSLAAKGAASSDDTTPTATPGMANLPSSSSFSAASVSSQGGRRVPSFEQAKARETWWSSGTGG